MTSCLTIFENSGQSGVSQAGTYFTSLGFLLVRLRELEVQSIQDLVSCLEDQQVTKPDNLSIGEKVGIGRYKIAWSRTVINEGKPVEGRNSRKISTTIKG